MHNAHARNTVRYYIIIAVLLLFLFFSNDFGMIDVQKTAIVTAVGIDRVDGDFSVTAQIAIPQSSTSGKSTQSVQIVSSGKTVADAFEEINAKTGWYPKLVFCNLILLGEEACKQDVFDALDYFLLDEYLSDNCLVAACDGLAKDILNESALVDPTSGVAIGKVLSAHAERVGTVLPNTLRMFAIGYFGDSKSSFLPIVKTEPQQEETAVKPTANSNGQNGGTPSEEDKTKPVFSASETALFVGGKRVGTLTAEETFAYGAVQNELKLAFYTVAIGGETCTLTIKQNSSKTGLKVGKDGRANLKIQLTLSSGIADYSKAVPQTELADVGDVPDGAFAAAEKKLAGEVHSLFEKAKGFGCDVFGVRDMLLKHGKRAQRKFADGILKNTQAEVSVKFQNVR